MQLVLVNTKETTCSFFSSTSSTNASPEYLRFEVSDLRSDSNRCGDCNDETGKALVSEIFSGVRSSPSVSVLLPVKSDEGWGVVNGTIFKKLQDKFPNDTLEVSAFLSGSLYDQTIDIASLNGRKSGSDNYMCTGTVNSSAFWGIKDKAIRRIHFKLTVDIPEKSETVKTEKSIEDFPVARKLYEEELFSDVIIVLKWEDDEEELQFRAHQCFLSAASPVLKRRFENELKESKIAIVEMPGATELGVSSFLQYIYYGDLEDAKKYVFEAIELLSMAYKYEVRTLENEVVKILKETPNKDFHVREAFKVYMLVRNIESAVELKGKVIQILKGQLTELKTLQEYKDIFEKPANSAIAMELFTDFANS